MKEQFGVFVGTMLILCLAGMLVDFWHGGHFQVTPPPPTKPRSNIQNARQASLQSSNRRAAFPKVAE
jgi:hypothetical protein